MGRHAAHDASKLPEFLSRWSTFYAGVRRGEMQVLSRGVAPAHRLDPPFRDGNGRVTRLQTHLVLGHMGLANGMWSPLP